MQRLWCHLLNRFDYLQSLRKDIKIHEVLVRATQKYSF